MVLKMRTSDVHLALHPVVWRLILGVASAGIGMLIGALIGVLAFGRGTVGAEFTVVAGVLATTVLSSFWMRNGITMPGSDRAEGSADRAEGSSYCSR